MKKMIKFIPLMIAPALALVACASANDASTSENSIVTDNAIATVNVTVDFDGGTVGGLPSKQYTVRQGTMYEYYKTKLPKKDDITYADHTFKHYSLQRDGETEISSTYQFNGDVTIFAVYEPVAPETTYTVTWKNDKGAVLDTETNFYHKSELPSYKHEDPTPEDPTPGTSYKFVGWMPAITPIVDQNQEYTAKYEPISSVYTVTFDTDGGTAVAAQTVEDGGKVTDPGVGATTKTGYDFDGWYKEAAHTNVWNFNTDTVSANTTIYAKWVDGSNIHTVNFHHNNETEDKDEVKVRNGDCLIAPDVPTYASHKFKGWYTAATEGTKFDFTVPFTKDTTTTDLFAQWDADPTPTTYYTVSFNTHGGSSVTAQQIASGGKVSVPASPTRTGYDFYGWYTEAEGGSKWDFDTDTISKNTTIHAHWNDGRNVHKISFYTDDLKLELYTEKYVRNGNRLAAPAVPTKSGKKFNGWYPTLGFIEPFDFDTIFEETTLFDGALFAGWTADPTPETKVTVTFDSQGGSTFQAQTFNKGGKATNPGTPTKLGYHFTGWHDAATGGSTWDFDTAINADKTLYAQWDDEGNMHTITFHPENDGSTFTKDVRNGECLVAPAVPTRDGFRFDGWFTAQTGGSQFDFSTVFSSETTTTDLYAQWTNVTPTDKITVNFDSQGGTSVPGQTIDKGAAAAEPTAPTKVGYDFDGWWTEATGGSKWTFDTTISENKTLYAHWTNGSNIHTITFHNQDGSPETTTTGTVRNGERLAAPAVPTYEGHSFDGWYTEAACTNAFDFNTEFKADTLPNNALYAKWTNVTPTTYYTVTFDTQGGSNVVSQQVAAGGLVTDPGQSATTKTGSTFGGWYKEAACTNAWNFSTDTVTKATTIYAKWTVNQFNITFKTDGGTWSTGGTADKTVPTKYNEMPNPGATVTKTGYTFNGWSPTLSPATTATTYTAQWTLKDCTVTFYDDDGTTKLYEIPVKYNTKVNKPKDPTAPSGKQFDKWVTTKGGTTEFNFDNPITGDTSVYARYTDKKYTIRWFNADANRTLLATTSVDAGDTPTYGGSTPTLAPDLTHRYIFNGWSPTIFPADADMSYYATYKFDDDITFSYESDEYALEGEYEFSKVEKYSTQAIYSFGDVDPTEISKKSSFIIDGQTYKYDQLSGGVSIEPMASGTCLIINLSMNTIPVLLNAHNITMEVK